MKHEKFKLENDELSFFYDFLFQYESDINHKGFNAHKLSNELRKVLANSQKNIRKPKDSNLILYTGKYVIRDFLRHLRNTVCHSGDDAISILPLDDGQVIREVLFYDTLGENEEIEEFAMRLTIEEVQKLIRLVADFYKNSKVGSIDKTENLKKAERKAAHLLDTTIRFEQ